MSPECRLGPLRARDRSDRGLRICTVLNVSVKGKDEAPSGVAAVCAGWARRGTVMRNGRLATI
jgi:hypothetical protein